MIAVWAKCRPRRPPPFLNPLYLSSAVGSAKKGSTKMPAIRQQEGMLHRPFHFVRDEPALKHALFPSSRSAVPAAGEWKR
jgi:hypothetical protein